MYRKFILFACFAISITSYAMEYRLDDEEKKRLDEQSLEHLHKYGKFFLLGTRHEKNESLASIYLLTWAREELGLGKIEFNCLGTEIIALSNNKLMEKIFCEMVNLNKIDEAKNIIEDLKIWRERFLVASQIFMVEEFGIAL